MSDVRDEFRRTHGERLPTTAGTIEVSGLERPVRIGRDGFGVPSIEAETEEDAFYGLGFCQGQDRTFQIEMIQRVARGTLAELVGALALPVDRLSRRIGFHRSARAQWEALPDEERSLLDAFARGVNDGVRLGRAEVPHEYAVLAAAPVPFAGVDVLAGFKVASMLLGTNWDVELARLRILHEDGLDALVAVDPVDPDWLPVSDPPGRAAGVVAHRLAAEAAALASQIGLGGGSNNWAVAGSRTAGGRALLANDPHLPPMLPAPWYLVRLETPEFVAVGASFAGAPLLAAGHNGSAAWGVTAAMTDASDLYLEELGPDGVSVREDDGFLACRVEREEIAVRGAAPVIEEVLVTPRGPIVGPALEGAPDAISLRATWLASGPTRVPRLHRARSFAEFRAQFAGVLGPATNHVYADEGGTIGWQLTGWLPRRREGWGTLPSPGWAARFAWDPDPVPFEEMPHAADPEAGFLATANNRPRRDGDGPFLGADFVDGYRVARIAEVLAERTDWDADGMARLQLDELSIPWRELREIVLAAPSPDDDAALGHELLETWDGRVAADSAAASVFELFLGEMVRRVVEARAPRSAAWAIGKGTSPLSPLTVLLFRRVGHLVRLLRTRPEGWLKRAWDEEIGDALSAAVRTLRGLGGEERAGWAWGRLRPLTLTHPLGALPGLGAVFNRGPMPWGGDMNTVAQAGNDLLAPTSAPLFIASLRFVVEAGRWDEARFVLAGGQSGNPLSPHYDDQLPLWQRGDALRLPWSRPAAHAAVRDWLELRPAAADG